MKSFSDKAIELGSGSPRPSNSLTEDTGNGAMRETRNAVGTPFANRTAVEALSEHVEPQRLAKQIEAHDNG